MLTLEQRIGRRVPVILIVLWCLMALTLIITVYRYSDFRIDSALTIVVLSFTIYYGHNNLLSSTRDYGYQVMFDGIISASENAHLFDINGGFLVEKTDDKECNILIAWRAKYKESSSWNPREKHSKDQRVFCIFFRVISAREDYRSVLPKEFEADEFPSHSWWDYSMKVSCINGKYLGRIVGRCNTGRRNTTQIDNMVNSDFVYARQAIGKIHTFDRDKMMKCKRDGKKYGVINLDIGESD